MSKHRSATFPIAVLVLSLLSGTAIGFFAGGGSSLGLPKEKEVATVEPIRSETVEQTAITPEPETNPQQAMAPPMELPPLAVKPPIETTQAVANTLQPTIQPMPKPKETKPAPAPETRLITFKEHVMPVFQARCIECHGDPSIKSGFDMRTLASIKTGGNGGPGLKVGEPEMSYLFERIADGSMPPRGKSPLSKSEQNLIREWIAGGAQ